MPWNIIVLLTATIFLQGCGLKGPLYLPQDENEQITGIESAKNNSETDTQNNKNSAKDSKSDTNLEKVSK